MLTADPPLKVKRGEGVYLELEDGRRIIDCISSWWVNIHGHAHPKIAAAIYEQAQKLEQVIFAGFTHEPAERIAASLLKQLPQHLAHVFFSDNGSTSVEVALKMAYQYWQNCGEERNRFIAFEGGYHGDTVGAMSMGSGSPFWQKFEPLMFSVDLVPYPAVHEDETNCEQIEEDSLNAIARLLESGKNEHAAICLEPLIQGAAGMRMCRPEFLRKLRDLASRFKTLLIYDEVMTGFGRTGDWFACKKSETTPDIICLSKGITGGFLPLSVTICNSEIYESFLDSANEKTFYHGHSYTANPLACAAANASMELLLETRSLFQNMESRHRAAFDSILNGHKLIGQTRYCGTIFATNVRSDESTGYFNKIAPFLKKRFVEKGFLIRPLGNTIYLMPPYCITTEELQQTYLAIRDVLDEIN